MKLVHAKPDRIEEITAMSVRAFETDVNRNARANAFYKKAGYSVIKEEDGFVFYQKKIPGRGPA